MHKKEIIRRFKISFVVFILLFGGIWLFLHFYGNSLLEHSLRTYFEQSSKGRYSLSFENLNTDFGSSGFSITGIEIKADSTAFLKSPNENWIYLTAPEASVSGISIIKLLFFKDFEARIVEINSPTLQIFKGANQPLKKESLLQKESHGFLIHSISVNDAQILMKDRFSGQFIFKADECHLSIDDFSITKDFTPVYRFFSFDSRNSAVTVFGGNEFKMGRLYLTGSSVYTGLIASELDLSEIEKPLRENLKIPDEIDFSLNGISLQSESLSNLAEQIKSGQTDQINLYRLLLISPVIRINTDATLRTKEPVAQIETVAQKLTLPQIGKTGIINGTLIWKDEKWPKPVLTVSEIMISATDIVPRFKNKIPLLFLTAEMYAGQTEFTPPGAEYSFSVHSWKYRSVTDSLSILGLNVYPHKNLEDFYAGRKWREDRLEFTSERIDFENLDLYNYALTNHFSPEKVVFTNPEIKSYTDKRLIHDPNFTKSYPLQKIKELNGNFNFKEIRFDNGKISYSEKVENSPGIGTLEVERVYMSILNLKSSPNMNDSLTLLFEGSFGDSSKVDLKMDIPLVSEDEIQQVKGRIINMDFRKLNAITENTVLLGFVSGFLDSCEFSFYAKNGISAGTSYFYYNDLKVKIYKVMEVPSYKSKVLINKGFLSLAANFLINRNNPTDQGYSNPGKIAFKRDMVKGPINFWIKSIMTGLMNTVIDDISELKDLQEDIKGLKSDSETGMWGKLKSESQRKKAIRKKQREN